MNSAEARRTPAAARRPSLIAAPLTLRGDWGASPRAAVLEVLERIRRACLFDIKLLSDRQPEKLTVESRTGSFPAIWLHDEDGRLAWTIVNIAPCAWGQLAYQFGHELGHVLCNSWDQSARPLAPCQWLEEALAEAFTIRGLDRLAESWKQDPPLENDRDYANMLRRYRSDLIEKYGGYPPDDKVIAWFSAARILLDVEGGESEAKGPPTLAILAEMEKNPDCVADLGALNRWPLRSGAALAAYLTQWEQSCTEIGAPGMLPIRLRELLGLVR
jgi:hypothetical protein